MTTKQNGTYERGLASVFMKLKIKNSGIVKLLSRCLNFR